MKVSVANVDSYQMKEWLLFSDTANIRFLEFCVNGCNYFKLVLVCNVVTLYIDVATVPEVCSN